MPCIHFNLPIKSKNWLAGEKCSNLCYLSSFGPLFSLVLLVSIILRTPVYLQLLLVCVWCTCSSTKTTPKTNSFFLYIYIESTSIFYGRGRNAKFLSPMEIRMHVAQNLHFAQISNIYLNSAFPIWLLMEL